MPSRTATSRLLALPLSLTLLLAACGDDGDEGAADDTTTTTEAAGDPTTTTVAEEEPADRPEVTVELLDPGAEPREPLRLALEEGDSSLAVLEFQIDTEQEVNGEPTEAPTSPPIRADLRLTVEEASDDRFVVAFAYESFGLANPEEFPEEQVEQFEQALAGVDQVTGTTVIDGRGQTLEGSVDVPDEVNPQVAAEINRVSEGIEQLSAPFPEEPVGEGARWSVSQEVTIDGFTTRQETVYTLSSRDGGAYVLDASTSQTADEGAIDMPDVPDTEVSVDEYDVSGTGRIEGDLANVVPAVSTMETSGSITLTGTEPDEEGNPQDFTIVQRPAISMTLTRED